MKPKQSYRWTMILLTNIAVLSSALAADPPPIPITAEQAFDAVAMQVDPATGDRALVTLVDVRDPVEIFFSGAPGAVDAIHLLDGTVIVPDWGKVRLLDEGKFIEYFVDGRYKRAQIAKIGDLRITQLALNIPYLFRTPGEWVKNGNFGTDVNALYADNAPYQVLILFCRTGGRSSNAAKEGVIDRTLFDAIYEIDDPDPETGGVGGFTGSNYKSEPDYNGGPYNGHVGFPGRRTDIEEHPSVAWMDSGLPIVTTTIPNKP